MALQSGAGAAGHGQPEAWAVNWAALGWEGVNAGQHWTRLQPWGIATGFPPSLSSAWASHQTFRSLSHTIGLAARARCLLCSVPAGVRYDDNTTGALRRQGLYLLRHWFDLCSNTRVNLRHLGAFCRSIAPMESLEAGIKLTQRRGKPWSLRHAFEVKLLIQTIGRWKKRQSQPEPEDQICLRINLQAVRHHAVAVEFPMRILWYTLQPCKTSSVLAVPCLAYNSVQFKSFFGFHWSGGGMWQLQVGFLGRIFSHRTAPAGSLCKCLSTGRGWPACSRWGIELTQCLSNLSSNSS